MLLERIAHPTRPLGEERVLLGDSVRANLRTLLHTQRGSERADPELGLSDLRDLPRALEGKVGDDVVQPTVEAFKRELHVAVKRYEPRLQLHQITSELEPGLSLRFVLQGVLVDGRARLGDFLLAAEVGAAEGIALRSEKVPHAR